MGKEEIRRRLLGITALAAEYCVTVENAAEAEREEFVASMLRLLPRIYIEFNDVSLPDKHSGRHCHCGDDDDCCGDGTGCGSGHCDHEDGIGEECHCHHHEDRHHHQDEDDDFDEYTPISLEEEEDDRTYYPSYIDEDYYENVRRHIEALLGPDDVFLETFEEDMKYSDTPIAASVSECLADIFQPLYNFISIVKETDGDELEGAYRECKENFAAYWSQTLCNVLRALNHLFYN